MESTEVTKSRPWPAHRRNDRAPNPLKRTGNRGLASSSSAGSSSTALPPFLWREHAVPGTEVKYLRTTKEVNAALESVEGPFGFDIEWKPSFVKGMPEAPIALLQLARPDQIFLIQLTAMKRFPSRLRDILENYEIVKAGVGIAGDAKKLWKDYGVSLLGAVELSKLARVSDPSRWNTAKPGELIGLARLVEAYCSHQLIKNKKVKLSNWEQLLDSKQIQYAASDALAGAIIYQHLLELDPGALPRDYTSNYIGGRCEPYVRPQAMSLQSGIENIQNGVYRCNVFGFVYLITDELRAACDRRISDSTPSTDHRKMNVQKQLRCLLQLNRLVELSPCRRYTTSNPRISRPVCERACRPIPRFAIRSRHIGHTSRQEGTSQAKALTTPLNWGVLGGIGLTALVLHTWLLSETYVLDAQLAPAEAERLDPATSIKFPTSLRLDGEPEMTLLGLGVRKVSFLGMKVYSVGFYADLSKVDNKALRQCKSPDECIHLLIQTTSCALRIVPTRTTSYTHLRDAFIRTIQARQALRRKDGSLTTEKEEALHTPIQQLKGFFPTAAFKKHEPLHIIISPPTVKPRELRLYQLGTVRDDWVATEFFLAYFHGTISPPLIEDVKENVEAIWLPNLRV
ncbi:unnamed protein product [Rhizoctonia solani]|uniref:3'-5' exonuclease n=1 Tax=Rhizoctonia solani TaxID=456999 RepID=A0A8H3HK08_9AGAM|nr:unnamed protein product [Rhizoctonia solani]